MTRYVRMFLAFFAVCALGLATQAVAHSKKEKTEPADGAVLAATPGTIGMTFDAPMRVTMIRLIDAKGGAHDITRTDNMAPVTEFTASPAPLGPGEYKVEWRGLAEDGHPMEGSFTFRIEN